MDDADVKYHRGILRMLKGITAHYAEWIDAKIESDLRREAEAKRQRVDTRPDDPVDYR